VAGPQQNPSLALAPTGHVMSCLTRPVEQAQLEMAVAFAIARFAQHQRLKQEVVGLWEALEGRKLIERARGAVMRRLGLGEHEAFAQLKRLSSHSNVKLLAVARKVLAAEVVFRELEDV
jgi:response regulator NasT